MIENNITINIKRDDGSIVALMITPLYVNEDGRLVPTGAYELTSETVNDIGTVAFHLDDQHQWEYCGDVLTEDEIEQVVTTIQKAKA